MSQSDRRVEVITGAAGGFGSNVARLVAHNGHDLALVDINREPLEKIADDFMKAGVRVETLCRD